MGLSDIYSQKEQAIVVLLEALDENVKAEKAVSELTASSLNVDTGLKLLLEKLDLTFKVEKIDDAYSAYSNFNVFVKKEEISMNDYTLEFEHLSYKMAEHDMKLPDTILAFKLLDGAGLNEAQRQLALTLGNDLTFSSMKSALKRIFSRSVDQAVVDTACTKTVCGLHWFNSYVDSLDEEQRKKVEIIESNTSFKFGDG